MRSVGVVERGATSSPLGTTLVDKNDLLAYAAHRAHVVGVDDGGDAILVGDVADEAIDKAGRDRIKA